MVVQSKSASYSKLYNRKSKSGLQNYRGRKKSTFPRTKREVQARGAIFLSNLPHGFYENAITAFMKQFGEVVAVKVARSQRNARPMGWAYIQFQHEAVAKIVSKMMNGYIMFEKLLKCQLIKNENLNIKMFKDSYLRPELCEGAMRKRKNQYLLETETKQNYEGKKKNIIKKKLNFLKRTLRILPTLGDLPSSAKITLETPLQTPQETPEQTPQKTQQTPQKNPSETPQTTKKARLRKPQGTHTDKKFVMEVDELDEEIILKTPLNVVKKINKKAHTPLASKQIICDDQATTIKKINPLKRPLPVDSLSKDLFNYKSKNFKRKMARKATGSEIEKQSPAMQKQNNCLNPKNEKTVKRNKRSITPQTTLRKEKKLKVESEHVSTTLGSPIPAKNSDSPELSNVIFEKKIKLQANSPIQLKVKTPLKPNVVNPLVKSNLKTPIKQRELRTPKLQKDGETTKSLLSKPPKDLDEAKTPKTLKEARTPKPLKEVKTPKALKEAKTPKPLKDAKTPKILKEANTPKTPLLARTPKALKETKNPKTPKETRTPKTPKETRTPKTPKETRTPKTPKETRTPKTPKGARTPKTSEGAHTIKEAKTPKTPLMLKETKTLQTPKVTKTPQTLKVTKTPQTLKVTKTPKTPKETNTPKTLNEAKTLKTPMGVKTIMLKKTVTPKTPKGAKTPKTPMDARRE